MQGHLKGTNSINSCKNRQQYRWPRWTSTHPLSLRSLPKDEQSGPPTPSITERAAAIQKAMAEYSQAIGY